MTDSPTDGIIVIAAEQIAQPVERHGENVEEQADDQDKRRQWRDGDHDHLFARFLVRQHLRRCLYRQFDGCGINRH